MQIMHGKKQDQKVRGQGKLHPMASCHLQRHADVQNSIKGPQTIRDGTVISSRLGASPKGGIQDLKEMSARVPWSVSHNSQEVETT